METFTLAPALRCTTNYGNRSTAKFTYLLPGYPVSYPVGYPGNELPDNGSPSPMALDLGTFGTSAVPQTS